MKKLISLAMVVILCGCFAVNSFAYAGINGEVFEFENHDGSITEYYLDENSYPYNYINGEKVYMALSLEHLKVTDPQLLNYLNSKIPRTQESVDMRAAPTDYVDISAIMANGNSLAWSTRVYDLRAESVTTRIMKFNESHKVLRIKTDNLVKANIWNMSKIVLSYYSYSKYEDTWYYAYNGTQDCTSKNGFGITHSPSTNPYGYVFIQQDPGIISFDLYIWSTYAW